MKKVDLKIAAQDFETISDDTHMFYNTETGEFDFFTNFMLDDGLIDEHEIGKFDDPYWISAPRQRDFNGYQMMVDFANTISHPRKHELLSVALEGKGAFRRFKDTLHRTGLAEQWYAFKHLAFIELAKDWCEENGLEYVDPR